MKIIIGAGGTSQAGWTSLERSQLDIRNRADWLKLFPPNSLDAVLSEHVLEHLTSTDAKLAASNVFAFLRPGGYWRIAVPDANNPDPKYQEMCRPHGTLRRTLDCLGSLFGEPGHQEHYNLASLTALFQSVGFTVHPLEWFDEAGDFHRADWSASDGAIKRRDGFLDVLVYVWADVSNHTSLIVDAVKI